MLVIVLLRIWMPLLAPEIQIPAGQALALEVV
jgi:hypothetical protein